MQCLYLGPGGRRGASDSFGHDLWPGSWCRSSAVLPDFRRSVQWNLVVTDPLAARLRRRRVPGSSEGKCQSFSSGGEFDPPSRSVGPLALPCVHIWNPDSCGHSGGPASGSPRTCSPGWVESSLSVHAGVSAGAPDYYHVHVSRRAGRASTRADRSRQSRLLRQRRSRDLGRRVRSPLSRAPGSRSRAPGAPISRQSHTARRRGHHRRAGQARPPAAHALARQCIQRR